MRSEGTKFIAVLSLILITLIVTMAVCLTYHLFIAGGMDVNRPADLLFAFTIWLFSCFLSLSAGVYIRIEGSIIYNVILSALIVAVISMFSYYSISYMPKYYTTVGIEYRQADKWGFIIISTTTCVLLGFFNSACLRTRLKSTLRGNNSH